MLIQFAFKNYKSFKDEAILDLSATKMTEFSDRVVSVGGEKILPVAAIYGANASGKSNVYSAFEYMRDYVVHSFEYGDEEESFEDFRPKTFRFSDETADGDTTFEVYFTIPNDEKEKIYNYGFCVGKYGVTEEWLNTKARTARKYREVFYRDKNTLDLSGLPKASRENIEVALENQVLVVSLGAKLRVNKCKQIRDWFIGIDFEDFADPLNSLFLHSMMPKGFAEDPKVRTDVVKYFSTFDNSIKDIKVEKIPTDDKEKVNKYKILTIHKKVGSDQMAEIPLQEESAGTLKMFALYPGLHEVLKNGGIYCIDELNARLHPLLVRDFILTFLNPSINTNHAQLIFTTHDTSQLSNHLLRRDEIWFTEKDEQGISTLYSLADFKDDEGARIRKDESYEKNYLLGKYGAIPSLKKMDIKKEK